MAKKISEVRVPRILIHAILCSILSDIAMALQESPKDKQFKFLRSSLVHASHRLDDLRQILLPDDKSD